MDERARRRIVRLIFLFFWLLPLEGILRKWLLPQIQGPLIFVRDPVVIAATLLYLIRQGGRLPGWFMAWFALVAGLLVLAVAQSVLDDLPLIVFLIGIRNYLLFVPITFVIADVMNVADLRRLLLHACWMAVPTALLVALQFYSPVESALNKGLTDDTAGRFTVIAGIVRPYGPFTFVVGQAVFSGLLVALTVIAFERRQAWRLGWLAPLAVAGSTMVMGAMSGARTFFATALLIIVAYMAGSLTSRRIGAGVGKLLAALVAVLVFASAFTVLFPRAYSAMSQRQADATRIEGSTTARALSMLSPVPTSGPGLSLIGEGLGIGSNAGGFALSGGRTFLLSEYEIPRVFQEAGVFGGGVIILARLGVACWLIGLCVAAGRGFSETSAFGLLGFCLSVLLAGQISGQNQLISFCWFSLGLCAAFARNAGYRVRTGAGRAEAPPAVPPRRPVLR